MARRELEDECCRYRELLEKFKSQSRPGVAKEPAECSGPTRRTECGSNKSEERQGSKRRDEARCREDGNARILGRILPNLGDRMAFATDYGFHLRCVGALPRNCRAPGARRASRASSRLLRTDCTCDIGCSSPNIDGKRESNNQPVFGSTSVGPQPPCACDSICSFDTRVDLPNIDL